MYVYTATVCGGMTMGAIGRVLKDWRREGHTFVFRKKLGVFATAVLHICI